MPATPWRRGASRRRLVTLISFAFTSALTLLFVPGEARAQFTSPQQVSGPGVGSAVLPKVMVLPGAGVVVLFENGTDLFYGGTNVGFGSQINITQTAAVSSRGFLGAGSSFQLHVVYQEATSEPGQTGQEVLLRTTAGGPFGAPVNLSSNDGIDDTRPVVQVNLMGHLDIAWQRQDGALDPEVIILRNPGTPQTVGVGTLPVLTDLGGGMTYVAYLRTGGLFGRTFDGTILGPEETLVASDVQAFDLAADAAGTVHCAIVSGGQVLSLARDLAGTVTAPELRDAGPVPPSVDVTAQAPGHAAVVFTRGGQVHFHELEAGIWSSLNLTAFTSNALEPAVDLDGVGHAHVVYQLFGAIFYITNTPTPVAEFTSDSTGGELPQAVTFTNQSTGIFSSVLWEYGDGTTSTSFHGFHEYTLPGSYTVKLTVTGPGGMHTRTRTNLISTTLPPNVLTIPHIQVPVGQAGVVQPIIATAAEPFQGFQLGLYYDETLMPVNDLTLDGSLVGALQPDFFVLTITPNLQNSTLLAAVVLDAEIPFTGALIPAGKRMIAGLAYDVPPSLPPGTTADVTITDDLGIETIFSPIQGPSIHPYPLHGRMTVVDPTGVVLFLRGDSNRNGNIDIADAIFSLGFLFSNGTPPPCPDSADANDDGVVNIADAIYSLGYLFSNGSNPPYPFPAPGLDPTEDAMVDCL